MINQMYKSFKTQTCKMVCLFLNVFPHWLTSDLSGSNQCEGYD